MKDITMRSSWMMFSFLLQYPDAQWQETADDMFVSWCELIQEEDEITIGLLIELVSDYIAGFAGMDSEAITAEYVKTFDFNKKANMYLTYGQLGEERERGPALLKLKQIYDEEDMILSSEELPDFLPLVLEYVAVAEGDRGISLLVSFRKALESIRDVLLAADSIYSHVLVAILMLLDHSPVKEGSFTFDSVQNYSNDGEVSGCGNGTMWAAAGYGVGTASNLSTSTTRSEYEKNKAEGRYL